MNDNTIIIDDKTKILSIKNKKQYTKMILRKEVNYRLLNGFTNIKELEVIAEHLRDKNYYEKNINNLSFIKTFEKLTFKNIKRFGGEYNKKKKMFTYYKLLAINLKSIEIPNTTSFMYSYYLEKLNNLEEIILNIDLDSFFSPILHINSKNLKKIIVKTIFDTYEINLDEAPVTIDSWAYDKSDKRIIINLSNELYKTKIIINANGVKIEKKLESLVNELIEDKTFIIPDYINNIGWLYRCEMKFFDKISLNESLITSCDGNDVWVISNINLSEIIIRNNDNMALFPERVIDVREYGTIDKFFIGNNRIKLVYDKFTIFIDKDGNIEKIDNVIEEEKEAIEDILNKYSVNELEQYLMYRKFLETLKHVKDSELNDAMDVIKRKTLRYLRSKVD